MRSEARRAFETEMAAGRRLIESGDLDEAFRRIERAHVLGQRYVVPHVRAHWRMLRIGLARRSIREIRGQVPRLVFGAIGSAVGVVPTGNTGGCNISMFARLPIDPELASLLAERRGMRVERSILLAGDAQRIVTEALTPKLLLHVAWPLLKFVPIEPSVFPLRWAEKRYVVGLRLFGVLPFGRQVINVSVSRRDDEHLEARDNGYGTLISKWDHRISIRRVEGGAEYTDRVEIRAGLLTPLVWAFAWLFYRHRQRRWRELVASGYAY